MGLRAHATEVDVVVVVDVLSFTTCVDIALGLQRNVDQRMAGKLLDHMVEEADAGGDVIGAGAVKIDRGGNRSFLGPAGEARPARGGAPGACVFAWFLHGQSLIQGS